MTTYTLNNSAYSKLVSKLASIEILIKLLSTEENLDGSLGWSELMTALNHITELTGDSIELTDDLAVHHEPTGTLTDDEESLLSMYRRVNSSSKPSVLSVVNQLMKMEA